MSLRTLIESILLEGEIDNIIKNRKEKMIKKYSGESLFFDLEDFENDFNRYTKLFIDNIPTPKKYISKYYDLVEKWYEYSALDIDEVFQSMYEYFNKWMIYKAKNLITKDILAQTPESLIDIVDEAEEKEITRKAEKEINKIYEDNRWLVIRVKSQEASCKYGSETRWCISATEGGNRYTGYGYSENNFIYFIIDKKNRMDDADVLYKMAVLVNKKTGSIQVWDAADKELTPNQESIVKRFIPDIFEAISKDSKIAMDEITEDYIRFVLNDDYSLKNIKDYKRTALKYNTDYSMLELKFQFGESRHFVEVIVDVKNNNISATFYRYELINNEETGERYYSFTPTSIISKVSNERITKSNFVKLIKELVIDLLNSPEVKKYFIDNPKEYFSNVNLYKDIETMGTKKVPQEAFITAIKLLKEKGEQNITAIRRIVDPKLQSSHNVKPLLSSLYSFGLIKLEKRGRNVIVVPTPKLVKTPLDKLI